MDENSVREFLLEQQSRPYLEVRKIYTETHQSSEGSGKILAPFFNSGEFLTLWSGVVDRDPFNYSVHYSKDAQILDRFRDSIVLMAGHLGKIEKDSSIMQWGLGVPGLDKSYTNSRTTLSVLEAMATLGQLEKVEQQNGCGDYYFKLPQ